MHSLWEILLMALRQAWGCRPWFTVLLLVCISGTSNQAWSQFYPKAKFKASADTHYGSCEGPLKCQKLVIFSGEGAYDYDSAAGTEGGSHYCFIYLTDVGPDNRSPKLEFMGRVESDAHVTTSADTYLYFDLVWKPSTYVPPELRPSIKLLLDAKFVRGIPCVIQGPYGGVVDGLPYEISPGVVQYRGWPTLTWNVQIGNVDFLTGGFYNGPFIRMNMTNGGPTMPEVHEEFRAEVYVEAFVIHLVWMNVFYSVGGYEPGYGADYSGYIDPTFNYSGQCCGCY